METFWNSVFDVLDVKFKSYYVVWKHLHVALWQAEKASLNRTM